MRDLPNQRSLPFLRGVALLALTTSTLHAQARSGFTLDQVLSAPFPTEMTAAAAGGGSEWVFDQQGSRNIRIALPPPYQARALTTYTGDNGQDITDLAWTPDGRAVVYVRGGYANGRGEYPNPT